MTDKLRKIASFLAIVIIISMMLITFWDASSREPNESSLIETIVKEKTEISIIVDTYSINIDGWDLKLYEWSPLWNRTYSCIIIEGVKGGATCYPKLNKVLKGENK